VILVPWLLGGSFSNPFWLRLEAASGRSTNEDAKKKAIYNDSLGCTYLGIKIRINTYLEKRKAGIS